MTPIRWMAAAGLLCWLAIVGVMGGEHTLEAALGLAAPLGVGVGTWLLAERAYRESPARLTQLMIGAFAVKLLFFGAYVVFVLSVLARPPVPFVVSFAICFVAVHLVEAFCFQQLFRGGITGR
jgi:hypothetical protein